MSSRTRYLYIGVLVLIVFVALGALLLRAVGFRPPVDAVIKTGATEVSATKTDSGKPKLRVAVSAMISPRTTIEYYAAFADYLADEVGMESELVVRKTYGEVNDLLISESVDVAFICTGAYVLGDNRDKMTLIAAPVVRGEENYYSYIIVHADSPVESLIDLEGQRFAFVDELSNTGRSAPRRLLQKQGLNPDEFFSRAILTGSHDKSIRAVADGVVEGAAIDHLIYEAMRLEGDEAIELTRVVEKIGPFGMPPIVVPAGTDVELAQKLREVFLWAGDDPRAREHLKPLGIDRFRVPDEIEYDAVVSTESIRSVIVRER